MRKPFYMKTIAHTMMHPCCRVVLFGLAMQALWVGPAAAQGIQQDYSLFANLTGVHRSSTPDERALPRGEWDPGATLLYSLDGERLRFFTELEFGKGGNDEIARLQLGWRLTPQDTFWVGRFHNPQGYWNTQFHHGVYTQTSISRPGIEEFDDKGGVRPSHFIGAQLEGTHAMGKEGSLRYEAALGAGAAVSKDGIESPAFFKPQHARKATAALRVSYSPAEDEPNQVGFFLGRNELPADDLAIREVNQTVAGVFAVRDIGPAHLFGAAFWLNNDVKRAGSDTSGSFTSAYVQAEYPLAANWTLYGRAESFWGAGGDPYLALFPLYVRRQGVTGVRWDVTRNQALTLEYARPHVAADYLNTLAIQWSAVFP